MALFFKDQTIDIHQVGKNTDRLFRTLILEVDQDTLSVSAYDQNGHLLAYPIGSTVEFYITRPDAVYSLQTTVVDKVVMPEPCLILRRNDEQITRLQRRKFFRVNVKVKVFFVFIANNMGDEPPQEEMTATQNLSAGGMYCSLHTPCNRGDHLQTQIYLPAEEEPVIALGKVVRIQKSSASQNKAGNFGIAFEDIQESHRARLTRFLFRIQARMLR